MAYKPPGKVETKDSDLIMMICTAGHVDHGKTSLVKQLTGCETDRLRVEKERGLTIELGFAPCMLRGNLSVGIVDVPGHEKFIKNMVSGIPGIDLSLLVIAADDGIMPQTIEHMQIMELLGVKSGIIALTKIDLVTEDRVKERTREITDFLRGTYMEGATICPVSSETYDGFFEFYDVLVEKVKAVRKTRAAGVFRMPVERTFSQQGFGAILSGIPLDGAIEVGTQVELVPGGHKGRIRGIQCFGKDDTKGGYGQCLALNISDFGKHDPGRGQVVCIPGYLKPSSIVHVQLKTIPNLGKPIKNAQEIKFHSGTSEVQGRIFLLDDPVLTRGVESIATIVLSEPVAAAVHDKFILRGVSPATTIAGGEILEITYAKKRPPKKRMAAKLKSYQNFFKGIDFAAPENAGKRIEYFLFADQKTGATAREISTGILLPLDVVHSSLFQLVERKVILAPNASDQGISEVDPASMGDFFVHAESYKMCIDELSSWIEKAAAETQAVSMKVSDLRKQFSWPPGMWQTALNDLNKGEQFRITGNTVALKGVADQFSEQERSVLNKIIELYDSTGYKSPRPSELSEMLNAPQDLIERLIEHLSNEKQLIRLSKTVILDYAHYLKAQQIVVDTIKEKGCLSSADFKYLIDSTRKYALAILDFLDARRITMCLAHHERKLTADYEKNLL